jgi:hypothetical protein
MIKLAVATMMTAAGAGGARKGSIEDSLELSPDLEKAGDSDENDDSEPGACEGEDGEV